MKNYPTLRTQAPSTRRIAGLGAAALLAYTLFTALAGSDLALALSSPADGRRYAVKVNADQRGQTIELRGEVTDKETQRLVAAPRVQFAAGKPAEARTHASPEGLEVVLAAQPAGADWLAVTVTISREGEKLREERIRLRPAAADPAPPAYSGQPLTLDLREADIRDVLRTFERITGLTMKIDPAVSGRVSVQWVDVPWDQALDELLRDHGLQYRLEGGTMIVTRR